MLHLIPMTWPEVMTIPTGPAVFHTADCSPVTPDKPARAGELLTMSVTGLGPTNPGLDPGKPFPALMEELRCPGLHNDYRVDFRAPEGTAAGMAALGLSVAWINGPEVKIPVQ